MHTLQTAADVQLVGGHLALDFVNTAEERGHPDAQDVLRTPSDLRVWGHRNGLLRTAAAEAGARGDDNEELARAVAARELLHGLFTARMNGTKPTAAQLAQLTALIAEAHAAGTLWPATDGRLAWHWSAEELASVRHVAVTAATALLEAEPSGRLKQCPGAHCGWLFLDTSKRGNRRWCSMSECGQEAKDEQRRARRRASRSA